MSLAGLRAAGAVALALALTWAPSTPANATTALPAQKSTRVFGATIRYFELGRGPTLVLVHGLGSSAEGDWGQVMRPLARTHHVIALDSLGFGHSDKPAIDYGIQTWVDFLGEFLRQRKVGAFTLAGESMGGWIAALYTAQALQGVAADPALALPKPARLLLVDAAGYRASWDRLTHPPAPGAAPPPLPASLAGQKLLMASIFHDPKYQSADGLRGAFAWSLAKGDAGTIRAVTANPAVAHETVDGKLGAINIPTLVVWGEFDALLPIDDGRAYASDIPGARLVVVPAAGHAPMIETPQAFLDAVSDFLDTP